MRFQCMFTPSENFDVGSHSCASNFEYNHEFGHPLMEQQNV